MSIIVKPDSGKKGAMCTATVQYIGKPVPNDVHIDAKHDDGTWHAITGYERIPNGMNPGVGFDIRFSGGNPNVGGTGKRTFRVRWTIDGEQIDEVPQETTATLGKPKPLSLWERFKKWWNSIDWNKVIKAIAEGLKAWGSNKNKK